MRTAAALVVAALLVMSVGGCLGSGGDGRDQKGVPASTDIVEPAPGVRIARSLGAVRGVVLDDASLSLQDALVVLLETTHYTFTNRSGGFLFLNVTPGSYTMRVDREGFGSNETPVEVSAGNITETTVYLLPAIDRGAGNRPHVHDFWGDEREVLLMDHDVDLTKDPESGYGAVPYPILSRFYYPNTNMTTNPPGWPLFLPDKAAGDRPAIILPATGELVVTFTWSAPDVVLDRLSLAYASADQNTWRFTQPSPSGTKMTVKVNSTMADSGHQTFTLWRFWVHADNSATQNNYKPGLVTGKIHVKMVLVKADQYLEPEHPAYWKDGDMLVLHNKSRVFRVYAGTTATSLPIILRDNYDGWTLPNGVIVPPGSKKMRITLSWSYPQSAGPLDFEHNLVWRVGNQAPRATPRSEFHSGTPKESMLGQSGHKTWEFELQPEWTDAFYQRKSNWLFCVEFTAQPNTLYHVEPRQHDVTLEVVVWKDPSYGEA